MKAVDTNILLRYIVRDHPEQFNKAAAFLMARTAGDPAYVSLIVVTELIWALRRRYRYSREDVHAVIAALLETAELIFEDELHLSALLANRPKGDIADHLIAFCAKRAECTTVVTFDRNAAKAIPSMELLS